MFKKYSLVDILFFIFLFLFFLLSIYELIRFIVPYYSFLRAIGILILVSGAYFLYKNKFDISRIQKNFNILKAKEKTQIISRSRNLVGGKKTLLYIAKYRDTITYSSFIAVSSIILLGMLFDTGKLLPWVLGIFTFIFVCAKILGFKINTRVQKSDISSLNTLRFFLLSFALFFIIMKLICDSFALVQSERILIYIGFSFAYLILGFFTFFRYTFSLSGFLRPYNILSAFLVFSLVGLLAYNNGFGDILKEKFIKPEVIIEQMDLPGIISDEARIIDQEVEYQQVGVSTVYDIPAGLSLGSVGQGVSELQTVLGNLQYFIGEVSGSFDEETRVALRNTLIGECDWPESTSGIFGPQAKQCIDNLEMSVPSNINNTNEVGSTQKLISQEIQLGNSEIDEVATGVLVSEIYELSAGMSLGSVGSIVSDLQKVLQSLGYYNNTITEEFDEETRVALRNTLIGECDWPESTSGIFGPQAKQCIDNLKILN